MKTLTLNIPDHLDVDNREAAVILATQLYERGMLSLGLAAELAGYSKPAFMELLVRYNVSLFNYDAPELVNDIRNASKHHL
ncbi:UPF0175 family protein [Cnuella takakiae]|uniref:UPF0175 family protein n=1 Tax=Cnuella takakiae TaxID=1302690 RepID=UPI000932A16C|nr:UPF0175 family protein [Cnuella takakiae]